MTAGRAVLWIDHHEARIFHVQPDAEEILVLAPQHHFHRHPKGHADTKEHPDDMRNFFHETTRALDGVNALLIVGPSSAKLEYFKYLTEHERGLAQCVVSVESADHPTDGEIVGRARKYFKAADAA